MCFSFRSGALTEEKTEVEESVSKGRELYEENHQRAVAAEVSRHSQQGEGLCVSVSLRVE